MNEWIILNRELKVGFRNPWAYSFLTLFTLFSIFLILIQAQQGMEGYTSTTGSLLHFILFLLPLMALILGSFSLTSEKEDGAWKLLATYSISTRSFIIGKFTGITILLITIILFGYGISGLFGAIFGQPIHFNTFIFFVFFSILLILLYTGISFIIGSIASNRWTALTLCVAVWFITIVGWPTILISSVGWLHYTWIKPALVVLTFLNPAELIRFFMVVQMDGGSIFGEEYYQWVNWAEGSYGSMVFGLVMLAWLMLTIFVATFIWERRRYRV
ncbi:ABC transporter permease [Longirhabdus pacifica]|uniref:ABC transporter permease n=1 Tax=Longirhabdus pacifica TaxID=2305227 RepID=UPI001008E4D5|nr:ABC transporter permease subunit [Longirhabdus pacifica]